MVEAPKKTATSADFLAKTVRIIEVDGSEGPLAVTNDKISISYQLTSDLDKNLDEDELEKDRDRLKS